MRDEDNFKETIKFCYTKKLSNSLKTINMKLTIKTARRIVKTASVVPIIEISASIILEEALTKTKKLFGLQPVPLGSSTGMKIERSEPIKDCSVLKRGKCKVLLFETIAASEIKM